MDRKGEELGEGEELEEGAEDREMEENKKGVEDSKGGYGNGIFRLFCCDALRFYLSFLNGRMCRKRKRVQE